ncbi:P-loop containing nucleoside triphosphate hydrolase protein [Exidia glandulosa HHB12029]|uniref:DNA 3'-5' helicase n=1 Tax=Exidia glandulosa HHB12029 TaxID=1314781 RepID=A0A165CVM8_EXIGL|nr:P-loop containing nucleoside triphosphate hydrolase protein [Exidia glandulosa HHB12029]
MVHYLSSCTLFGDVTAHIARSVLLSDAAARARRTASRTVPTTIEATRAEVKRMIDVTLCDWQAAATLAQNTRKKHVVVLAPCGGGKTLAFLSAMLFNPTAVRMVVSPLLALGHQHVKTFTDRGIPACEFTSKTISESLCQQAEVGVFRSLIGPPEAWNANKRVRDIVKHSYFSSHLSHIIFDEGHLIKEWGGTFRPEYSNFDVIMSRLQPDVKIVLVSATFTRSSLRDTMSIFNMTRDNTEIIRVPNELRNIFYAVRRMSGPADRYDDLVFLLPDNPLTLAIDAPAPPKFMVFMQSKTDCKNAALHLRRMLPEHHQDKVCWFTADKTDAFKDNRMKRFTEGSVWGMFCTDAAGLGLDVNDIRICVQWGIEGLTFEGLYQRFGRGGRNRSLQGVALLFVEDRFYPKTGDKRKRTAGDEADEDESESDEPVSKRPCIEQSQDSNASMSAIGPPSTTVTLKGSKPRHSTDPAVLEFAGLLPRQGSAHDTGHNGSIPCRLMTPRSVYDFPDIPFYPSCGPDCQRCNPPVFELCCDLHLRTQPPASPLPAWIARALDWTAPVSDQKRTNRVRALKSHIPGDREKRLRTELIAWRQSAYEARRPAFRWGPCALLSDNIIDRIVSIAHRQSSSSPPMKTSVDLKFQTRWELSDRYGDDILKCIARVFPPAPPPRVPLSETSNTGTPPTRKPPTCSSCSEANLPAIGHRSNENRCPLKLQWTEILASDLVTPLSKVSRRTSI